MADQYSARIVHSDGRETVLQVAARSEMFAPEAAGRWLIVPPAGLQLSDDDRLVTDLPEGSYDWSTPIGDVLMVDRTLHR